MSSRLFHHIDRKALATLRTCTCWFYFCPTSLKFAEVQAVRCSSWQG